MKIECSVSELASLQKTDELLKLTNKTAEMSAAVRELQTAVYSSQDTIHRLQGELEGARREKREYKQGAITGKQFEVLASICMHMNFHEFILALQDGQKISAIKLYREMRCVGLKEAKDAVEVLVPPQAYY